MLHRFIDKACFFFLNMYTCEYANLDESKSMNDWMEFIIDHNFNYLDVRRWVNRIMITASHSIFFQPEPIVLKNGRVDVSLLWKKVSRDLSMDIRAIKVEIFLFDL
jgi:hypothetical protein